MRRILTLICLIWPMLANGQNKLPIDFQVWPGDWTGDTMHFQARSSTLMLNAPKAGRSFIVNKNQINLPAAVKLEVALPFAPSANNQVTLYFINTLALGPESQGYALQLGESGDQDAWEFFSIQGVDRQSLTKGKSIPGAGSNVLQYIDIHVDTIFWWCSAPDEYGDTILTLAPIVSTLDPPFFYFGLECEYTETRKDKFTFKHLGISTLPKDTIPPQVRVIKALTDKQIELGLNEPVEVETAQNTKNYWLRTKMEYPRQAELTNPNQIVLSFPEALPVNQQLDLELTNIQDRYHNAIKRNIYNFILEVFDPPVYGDILINEIMADPAPSQGLPLVEYVELFNNSLRDINLEGCIFAIGRSSITLQKFIIPAGGFLLLSDKDAEALLAPYGKVYGLSDWPGISNSSGTIRLINAEGLLIHQISYDQGWYGDDRKGDGGFSLEMIEVENHCALADNWRASRKDIGGTPGQPNSLEAGRITPVIISDFKIAGQDTLIIKFTRILDDTALSPARIAIEPRLTVQGASPINQGPEWRLIFNESIQQGVIYHLTLVPPLIDCAGIWWTDTIGLLFGALEKPRPRDVVFNEILFNPKPNRQDYLELYNRTGQFLDLSNLALTKNLQENGSKLSLQKLAPYSYACLSPEGPALASFYPVSDPLNITKQSLPSLPDEAGLIFLVNTDGEVMDYQFYHQSWHHPLIDNTEGVALERISINDTARQSENWASAGATVKYGTPGVKNSQTGVSVNREDSLLVLDKTIFSPDGDGFDDELGIELFVDRPGYSIQMQLYDERGRLIRNLLPPTIIGLNYSHFTWDGTNIAGEVLPMGRYIIFARFIHPAGQVRNIKRSIVLAGFIR